MHYRERDSEEKHGKQEMGWELLERDVLLRKPTAVSPSQGFFDSRRGPISCGKGELLTPACKQQIDKRISRSSLSTIGVKLGYSTQPWDPTSSFQEPG